MTRISRTEAESWELSRGLHVGAQAPNYLSYHLLPPLPPGFALVGSCSQEPELSLKYPSVQYPR